MSASAIASAGIYSPSLKAMASTSVDVIILFVIGC